ncbi:MAG TPA: TolC family protein [Tenuifilaceae bacterium]|nr:TolC family protein [Tenuifilaceae bacterium]
MRRLQLLFMLIFVVSVCNSQTSKQVSLSMLYEALEQNHPIAGIMPAMDSSLAIQTRNMSTIWYPKLDFNATATWQSEVIEINIPFPGISIPSPDADQYKLTIDATQVIWDGGATKARKGLAESQNLAEKSVVKNEIYSLREKINDAFYAVILLDISSNQLKLMKDELQSRLESIQSGVRQGVILESNMLSIQAEIVRLEQKMLEIPLKKASLISMIETFTGADLAENPEFILSGLSNESEVTLFRPELESFELQKKVFDSMSDLTSKKRMPTLGAFVSAGYGKPGLNMLSNDWNTYVLAGAKLSWNIWDWNSTKREKQQLMIQKSIVNRRKESFCDAVNSQIESCLNDIHTLNQQLEKDEEIVSLLNTVKEKSSSKLDNGVISSSEYLSDFNSAARASLDMEYRKVLLDKEKTKLYFLMGKNLNQ